MILARGEGGDVAGTVWPRVLHMYLSTNTFSEGFTS